MDRLRRRFRGKEDPHKPTSCRVYNPHQDPYWLAMDREQRQSKRETERTLRGQSGPLDDILFPQAPPKRGQPQR